MYVFHLYFTELVRAYSYDDLKDLGGFVELFGLSNSTFFKFYVDLYSNKPECESITLKFASPEKTGASEEINFHFVTKSYGADVRLEVFSYFNVLNEWW